MTKIMKAYGYNFGCISYHLWQYTRGTSDFRYHFYILTKKNQLGYVGVKDWL